MPGTIGDLPSTPRELHMATNAELLKDLKLAPRARFYLCDLHVYVLMKLSCNKKWGLVFNFDVGFKLMGGSFTLLW